MDLGRAQLRMSGTDFRLGEPPMQAESENRGAPEFVTPFFEPKNVQPLLSDARLIVAMQDLTAAIQTLTIVLSRPPWYTRVWAWLRTHLR